MFFFGKKIAKKKVNHFETLSEKWTSRHRSLQEKLWAKHASALKEITAKSKQFAATSLAGLMLMASPGAALSSSVGSATVHEKPFIDLDASTSLLLDLHAYLPKTVEPLTAEQEQQIGSLLSKKLGVTVSAQLNGKRLNRSYGYIGQEQHLARFPGDSIDTHFASGEDTQKYYEYGMAPGLGAYGYFAKSANGLTP